MQFWHIGFPSSPRRPSISTTANQRQWDAHFRLLVLQVKQPALERFGRVWGAVGFSVATACSSSSISFGCTFG